MILARKGKKEKQVREEKPGLKVRPAQKEIREIQARKVRKAPLACKVQKETRETQETLVPRVRLEILGRRARRVTPASKGLLVKKGIQALLVRKDRLGLKVFRAKLAPLARKARVGKAAFTMEAKNLPTMI